MKKLLLVTVLLGSTFSLAALASDCSDEARYPEISYPELRALIGKGSTASAAGATVIDVNGQESFDRLHVPGAIHFASAGAKFTSKLPKNKNALIVAYCGGPMCTAWKKAAEQACAAGYTNVKHFKEGITGWERLSKSGT